MAINPQVQALFTLLDISANPNEITGLNTQALETLAGGPGSDYILGQGNDYLEGGAGIDAINGGAGGRDTAGYANASNGVTVLMTVGGLGTAIGGDGLADTLTGIENVVGSNFDDTITGDNLANVLAGLGGNDTLNGGGGNDILVGGAGADVLNGGAGIDTADYSTSTVGGVTVGLAGAGSGGDAAGDTYSGIETVIGTNFDDVIGSGRTGSVTLYGGNGADSLTSVSTGSCVLVGGAGNDQLSGLFGTGAVTYKYLAPDDFVAGERIVAFNNDKIDLSAIDAIPSTPADDPFHFGSDLGGIVITQQNSISDLITFGGGLVGVITVGLDVTFFGDPLRGHLTAADFIL
ncbi:calcium-binding protein [Phyllobacterium chamaecytisi]|uniref:calcium-binding protein n=1 Tax=Phyllobacterium chamaecytisi TaxID=2876082 RepID=UPI001CCCF568|nr:calcium-binding protein [Phyllobacterium sp. KW56]MBZ9600565.1 hypothetical protein [Phyllobacterium sp. KW56]